MIRIDDVERAAALIHGTVLRTPLVHSRTLSRLAGCEIYLKLENLQEGGSFKVRGAAARILAHRDEIGPAGVIAASAGNHAQGVAIAARAAGIPAAIVMPEWVSITKQEATRGYGAEVILKGNTLIESINVAQQMAGGGRTFIHPYDDPEIIAGQGTIALEIFEDLQSPDLIVVPVGGGGLIGGIASVSKSIRPQVRVVGVQAAACPSAVEALKASRPVRVIVRRSIADALSVTQVGDLPFRIMQDLVDEIVLADEESIAAAVLMLLERKRILAEGAGAIPLAAILSGALKVPPGGRVVLVISGGNLDSFLLDRILRQGLSKSGRIMRFSVCLEDVPGSLARLLSIVAGLDANIVHIRHDRARKDLPINMTRVELELETRGTGHISGIVSALDAASYRIEMK